MIDLLLAVEQSSIASTLRSSFWLYPIINASHILSLALLVGSILIHDLRVLGVGAKDATPSSVDGLVVRLAAAGLVGAIITGALLFAVKATEYAFNPAFQIKLVLVAAGIANVMFLRHKSRQSKRTALLSAVIWISALFAGRFIAFV